MSEVSYLMAGTSERRKGFATRAVDNVYLLLAAVHHI